MAALDDFLNGTTTKPGVLKRFPYNENDTITNLTAKITFLLHYDRIYTKLLNKITPLTLTNYKQGNSEYIAYTVNTPYIMKDYIKPFIKKYIELSDSYNSIINIFKNPELKLSYIHRNIPKYVKDVEEECLYFYVSYEQEKYNELISDINTQFVIKENVNNSYIEIKKYFSKEDYIIIARILLFPNNFTINDDYKTVLFMSIYEKSLNPYFINDKNELLINKLLKEYITDDNKKNEILQHYNTIDMSIETYKNAFIMLINYIYPDFHSTLQNKLIKLLEKAIFDFIINIHKNLDNTNSKIVLVGGASFNIVTGKTGNINDFDFVVYSNTSSKSLKSLIKVITDFCNTFKDTLNSSNTFKSIKSSPIKNNIYTYDISNSQLDIRVNTKFNRISIDVLIPETFNVNDNTLTNMYRLPIIDITFKDNIVDDIYTNISKPCNLMLNDKDIYGTINILSQFGLIYNINNTEITKRSLEKQSKDKARWKKLQELTYDKDIYTYQLPQQLSKAQQDALKSVEEALKAAKTHTENRKLSKKLRLADEKAKKEAEEEAKKEAEKEDAERVAKAAAEKVKKDAAKEIIKEITERAIKVAEAKQAAANKVSTTSTRAVNKALENLPIVKRTTIPKQVKPSIVPLTEEEKRINNEKAKAAAQKALNPPSIIKSVTNSVSQFLGRFK